MQKDFHANQAEEVNKTVEIIFKNILFENWKLSCKWKSSKLDAGFLDSLKTFPLPGLYEQRYFMEALKNQNYSPLEVITFLLEVFSPGNKLEDRIQSLSETWDNASDLMLIFIVHSILIIEAAINKGRRIGHPYRRFLWRLSKSVSFSQFLQSAIQSESKSAIGEEHKTDFVLFILQHFCLRRTGYVKDKGPVFDLKFLVPLFDDITTQGISQLTAGFMIRLIHDLRIDDSWKALRPGFPDKLVDVMSNYGEKPLIVVEPTRRGKFLVFDNSEEEIVTELHIIMAGHFGRHGKDQYQTWACTCVHCLALISNKGTCCSGCKMVRYCSRRCQANDWKAYKKFCVRIRNIQGL